MTEKQALLDYTLRLADTAMILGHRLSEMLTHGPMLEEEIAASNIALDFIGQANNLYVYASKIEDIGKTEDDYAFMRNERDFKNTMLVEQPTTDFAHYIVRQFLNDAFDLPFYTALCNSKDETLAQIAEKSVKEITYHLRHSSKWLERLALGTEESNQRTKAAIQALWPFTGELFEMNEVDAILIKQGIAVDLKEIQQKWVSTINEAFLNADLSIPEQVFMHSGSRKGVHTEHLGFLLAEMQSLHRTFPGVSW